MSENVPFHNLPADRFPFTIEFLRVDTKEVVHTIRVEGAGALVVPPLAQQYGVRVSVRVTFPDGEVVAM